jgi:hypothetical protein
MKSENDAVTTFIKIGDAIINPDHIEAFVSVGQGWQIKFASGATHAVRGEFDPEDPFHVIHESAVIPAPPGWRAIVGSKQSLEGFPFETFWYQDVIAFEIVANMPAPTPITAEWGNLMDHCSSLPFVTVSPGGCVSDWAGCSFDSLDSFLAYARESHDRVRRQAEEKRRGDCIKNAVAP